MSCDCLDKVKAHVEGRGGQDVRLESAMTGVNLTTGKAFNHAGALEVSYVKLKKDGSLGKARSKITAYYSFCPFCGVKYEPLEERGTP